MPYKLFFLQAQFGSVAGKIIVNPDDLLACLANLILRENNCRVITFAAAHPCGKIAKHCYALAHLSGDSCQQRPYPRKDYRHENQENLFPLQETAYVDVVLLGKPDIVGVEIPGKIIVVLAGGFRMADGSAVRGIK